MNRTLWFFLLVIGLLCVFTGCQGVRLKTRNYTFTHGQLGVNTALKSLTVIVLPNGAHVFILSGLSQNQSESARSISEGAVSALTKTIIP